MRWYERVAIGAALGLIVTAASAQGVHSCRKGAQCTPWSDVLGACATGWIPSSDQCPETTPTATPTPTPTATATPTAAAWTWEPMHVHTRTDGDGYYDQEPTAIIVDKSPTDQGAIAVSENRGWFHWPNIANDHEETGHYLYPFGGTPSWQLILRSGRPGAPFDAYDTHETGSTVMLFALGQFRNVNDRTTLASLPNAQHPNGCAENRIFDNIASAPSLTGPWAIGYDLLRPWDPRAGIRCQWTSSAMTAGAASLATAISHPETPAFERPGFRPHPAVQARSLAVAAAGPAPTPTPEPVVGGNIGWVNALWMAGGQMPMLATYDSSVPGGPWVVYQITQAWSAKALMGAMELPYPLQGAWGGWLDDVAAGVDGKLHALWLGGTDYASDAAILCPTVAAAWPNCCEVRELVTDDIFGMHGWKLSGRSWKAPAGKAIVNACFLRRATDGMAYPGVMFAIVSNGINPPDPASRWDLWVGYSTPPPFLTDLRKPVTN